MSEKQWLTLEETQQAFYELLIEFDRICKQNGLRYDLCGGSMLGAVRHQGFIPWDDDIDVSMPRPDYERFLKLSLTGNLGIPEGRAVISNRNDSFARHYARYIRKDVGSVLDLFDEADSPYLGIDIFTVDGMPENTIALNTQVWIIRQLRKLMLTSVQTKNGSRRSKLISAVKNMIQPVLKAIGSFRISRAVEWWCRRVPYESAQYVGILNGMYGTKERWLKKDMLPQQNFRFRDGEYPGYVNYHTYLSNIYGTDYMQLPPIEKQKPHGAKAFKIK